MDKCEFLFWAGTLGLPTIAGVLLSYIVELFPRWAVLPSRVKRLAFGGFCLVVGAIVTGFTYLLCPEPLDWWVVAVAAWAAFSAFGSGTLAASGSCKPSLAAQARGAEGRDGSGPGASAPGPLLLCLLHRIGQGAEGGGVSAASCRPLPLYSK